MTLLSLAPSAAAAPAQASPGAEENRRQPDVEAETRLIETYVPRLMLREQESPPCDTAEEQYEATTVDTVLGNHAVQLTRRPPDGEEEPLGRAPAARDIAGLGEDHHLNLPGDPLGDTCVYAKDFAELKRRGRAPAVTYAHIARERGRAGLAVQYWFFWYFNQFNDLHEGDWEGMQITFASSDPARALEEGPEEIGLFQHGGGERARWEDPKVEKQGSHPVVYPAAGSHATFYAAAVYVENGRKGSGVGCDNTTEPLRELKVRPIQVPTDPGPRSPHAWLTYEGRWGQYEKGFNNGPTGPATKDRWLEPFTWMEEIRTTSPRLPGGSVLGPTVTHAFCGAVADVTSFLNDAQRRPWILWAVPLALLLLIGLVAWRTHWRPIELQDLRGRRAFGQLIVTSARLYHRHWRAFAPIGLLAIAIVVPLLALSRLLTGEAGREIDDTVGQSGLHVALGELVSGVGQPLALVIVGGAVVVAMRQLADEGRTSFLGALRETLRRFRRLVGVALLATLMLVLMAATVIGLPFAAWKYIGWLFVQQQVVFAGAGLRDAFRGSSALVRGRWWYTLRVAAFLWLISVATGPLLGFALIFTTLPLLLINVIGTVVFAVLIPYVVIGQTLLFFDLEAEPAPKRLLRQRLRGRAIGRPQRASG
jgi:hypothetical protein